MLAIVLLDNLTLSEGLDLFLTQRTKAVRHALTSCTNRHSSQDQDAHGETTTMVDSHAESVAASIQDAVKMLVNGTTLAKAVFEPRRKLESESLIEEMIRLLQKGETMPTSQQPTPVKAKPHERRASRLASISLPLPRLNSSSRGPPISSVKVIQTLPSSQILLRYLPKAITAFAPFITPSPSPAVDTKLAAWQSGVHDVLSEKIPLWLQELSSVADVWRVRQDTFHTVEAQADIADLISFQCVKRVKDLWRGNLDHLLQLVEERVNEAAERIRSDPQACECSMAMIIDNRP